METTIKSMTRIENRSTPRFKGKSGSHIFYLEGFGAIRDLSLKGMYVVDPEPLPDGTKIKFAFRSGSLDVPMEGVVTRSEPGKGMVILFTDLSREAIRRLKIHITELGPPLGEPKER